jgi:hypothetical protein
VHKRNEVLFFYSLNRALIDFSFHEYFYDSCLSLSIYSTYVFMNVVSEEKESTIKFRWLLPTVQRRMTHFFANGFFIHFLLPLFLQVRWMRDIFDKDMSGDKNNALSKLSLFALNLLLHFYFYDLMNVLCWTENNHRGKENGFIDH